MLGSSSLSTDKILQSISEVVLATSAKELVHEEQQTRSRSSTVGATMWPGGPPPCFTEWAMEDEEAWRASQHSQPTEDTTAHRSPAMVVVSANGAASPRRSAGGRASLLVPSAVEKTLAPLELLYGRTFWNAVEIALHHAEEVVRYVEQRADESPAGELHDTSRSPETDLRVNNSVSVPPRSLYRVGDYTLFSPYFCPCSAYAFQAVRRRDVSCCKHMLALQFALQLEAQEQEVEGISGRHHTVRVKYVPSALYQSLLNEALAVFEK